MASSFHSAVDCLNAWPDVVNGMTSVRIFHLAVLLASHGCRRPSERLGWLPGDAEHVVGGLGHLGSLRKVLQAVPRSVGHRAPCSASTLAGALAPAIIDVFANDETKEVVAVGLAGLKLKLAPAKALLAATAIVARRMRCFKRQRFWRLQKHGVAQTRERCRLRRSLHAWFHWQGPGASRV